MLLEFEYLVKALTSMDSQQFNRARETLLAIGESVVPCLLDALVNATSDRDRWRILSVLAEIGDPRVVPTMINHLHAQNGAIRALAAQYLGSSGSRAAVEPMIRILEAAEPGCSPTWIINALGELDDQRAIDPLIAFLHCTESPTERYSTIEALGRLGDSRTIETVRRYADDPDHHVRDRVKQALQHLAARAS